MATTIPKAGLDNLRSDTIAEIELLLEIVWQLFALFINPWPPSDAPTAIRTYLDQIPGLLTSIAGNIAVVFTGQFDSTHNLLYTLVNSVLGPFGKAAADDYTALLKDIFDAYSANLIANKSVNPDDAATVAAFALDEASALGVGSRLVTLLFELFLPKQLNFMNWLGPQLAAFSGYDQIIELVSGPQRKAAIGNLAEYKANKQFRTVAPEHFDAEQMYARRLITRPQLQKLVGWSGLMTEFEEPMLDTAYRSVQPRALASLYQDVEFDEQKIIHMLQFAGIRGDGSGGVDDDISTLVAGFKLASVKNVRNQYVAGVARAAELGVLTDAEVEADLTDLGFSDDAKHWVRLTIATRKLEQLAELYRKSISEAYAFGNITDADYVNSLEAIGISAADAQAHYAIDSIKKHGQDARAIARAAAAEQRVIDRAMVEAAKADYRQSIIDDVELAAKLAAAQVPALAIPFAVEVEIQKAKARQRYVFGVLLGPDKALHLRERVAALKEQRIKNLVDDTAALAKLASWTIPAQNAGDLVAQWSAQASKTLRSVP